MFCHSLGCQSLGHLRSTWIALSACVVFARLIAKHGVFLVGTLRKSEELCVHVSELVQGSQERKCLKASVIARNLEPAHGRKTNVSISICKLFDVMGRPNVGGASIRCRNGARNGARNCAPPRKGCVINASVLHRRQNKQTKTILRTNARPHAPLPPSFSRTMFRVSGITPASPLI